MQNDAWAAAVAGVAAYLAFFSGGHHCEATVHNWISAPGGRIAAVVFEMECGATVPFNTQVSLTSANRPFLPGTNAAFLILSGKHDLVVRWGGEKTLEVTIPSAAQVFRNEPSVDGVTVEYR